MIPVQVVVGVGCNGDGSKRFNGRTKTVDPKSILFYELLDSNSKSLQTLTMLKDPSAIPHKRGRCNAVTGERESYTVYYTLHPMLSMIYQSKMILGIITFPSKKMVYAKNYV